MERAVFGIELRLKSSEVFAAPNVGGLDRR
jgi:hypothetical protein